MPRTPLRLRLAGGRRTRTITGMPASPARRACVTVFESDSEPRAAARAHWQSGYLKPGLLVDPVDHDWTRMKRIIIDDDGDSDTATDETQRRASGIAAGRRRRVAGGQISGRARVTVRRYS
jgi:hypothetical protein